MATPEQFNLTFTHEVLTRLDNERQRPPQVLAYGATALDGYQVAVARGTIGFNRTGVDFLVSIADYDPGNDIVRQRLISIDDHACDHTRWGTKLYLTGKRGDNSDELVEIVTETVGGDNRDHGAYYKGQLLTPRPYDTSVITHRPSSRRYITPGRRSDAVIDQDS